VVPDHSGYERPASKSLSYRDLDASYMQEQGLRDEADTLLRAQAQVARKCEVNAQ
jgi:hypothetical protein